MRTIDEASELHRRLERAASDASSAASHLEDAIANLASPEERDLDWNRHQNLVTVCQWLIQQEVPAFAEMSDEQKDLVEALEALGQRAGV